MEAWVKALGRSHRGLGGRLRETLLVAAGVVEEGDSE